MPTEHTKPIEDFRGRIHDIMGKFTFNDAISVDPDTGIMHMPEGAARFYHHEKTNTIHLVFSKSAVNLTDTPNLEYCYPIRAEPCKNDLSTPLNKQANYDAMRQNFRLSLDNFRQKYKDRALKHFTNFRIKFDQQPSTLQRHGINTDTDTIVSTNGNYTYIHDIKDDGHQVSFYVPAKRQGGSFIPPKITQGGLKGSFNKHAKILLKGASYEQTLEFINDHWNKMSSISWDEKSIFSGNGRAFRIAAEAKRYTNKLMDDLPKRAFVAATTGSVISLYNPDYGLAGALAASAIHTVHDVMHDSLFDGARARREELNEIQKHNNFALGKDCKTHFILQTRDEIGRLCPHYDLTQFPNVAFTGLNFDTMNTYSNDMIKGSFEKSGSIEELITYLGQRGISSICLPLDDNTILNNFQNGIVRLAQYDADKQTHRFYTMHIPALCKNDKLQLPAEYAQQIEGKILYHEYKNNPESFDQGIQNVRTIDDVSDIVADMAQTTTVKSTGTSIECAHDIMEIVREAFDHKRTSPVSIIPRLSNLGAQHYQPVGHLTHLSEHMTDDENNERRRRRFENLANEVNERMANNDFSHGTAEEREALEAAYLYGRRQHNDAPSLDT